MFYYIIFFISDTHHQSKVKISKITPAMAMVIIFVRLLIAKSTFFSKSAIYVFTESDMPDKNNIKNQKNYISTFYD